MAEPTQEETTDLQAKVISRNYLAIENYSNVEFEVEGEGEGPEKVTRGNLQKNLKQMTELRDFVQDKITRTNKVLAFIEGKLEKVKKDKEKILGEVKKREKEIQDHESQLVEEEKEAQVKHQEMNELARGESPQKKGEMAQLRQKLEKAEAIVGERKKEIRKKIDEARAYQREIEKGNAENQD